MNQIDTMKLALETLEYWDVHGKLHQPTEEAITALREALAEQPAHDQRPFCYHDGRNIVGKEFAHHSDVFPLYTAPQPEQQDWEAIAADQAMTIALLRAEQPAQGCDHCNHALYSGTKCKNCGLVAEQAAIKRGLTPEQPAQQQEPKTKDVVIANMGKPFTVKAYVDPQPAQRTWVGLTHDEYDAICDKHSAMSDFDFLEDIEAKLKEKNT